MNSTCFFTTKEVIDIGVLEKIASVLPADILWHEFFRCLLLGGPPNNFNLISGLCEGIEVKKILCGSVEFADKRLIICRSKYLFPHLWTKLFGQDFVEGVLLCLQFNSPALNNAGHLLGYDLFLGWRFTEMWLRGPVSFHQYISELLNVEEKNLHPYPTMKQLPAFDTWFYAVGFLCGPVIKPYCSEEMKMCYANFLDEGQDAPEDSKYDKLVGLTKNGQIVSIPVFSFHDSELMRIGVKQRGTNEIVVCGQFQLKVFINAQLPGWWLYYCPYENAVKSSAVIPNSAIVFGKLVAYRNEVITGETSPLILLHASSLMYKSAMNAIDRRALRQQAEILSDKSIRGIQYHSRSKVTIVTLGAPTTGVSIYANILCDDVSSAKWHCSELNCDVIDGEGNVNDVNFVNSIVGDSNLYHIFVFHPCVDFDESYICEMKRIAKQMVSERMGQCLSITLMDTHPVPKSEEAIAGFKETHRMHYLSAWMDCEIEIARRALLLEDLKCFLDD